MEVSTGGGTTTFSVAMLLVMLLIKAVMLVLPPVSPFASPLLSIEATLVLELFQLAEPDRSCELPSL